MPEEMKQQRKDERRETRQDRLREGREKEHGVAPDVVLVLAPMNECVKVPLAELHKESWGKVSGRCLQPPHRTANIKRRRSAGA